MAEHIIDPEFYKELYYKEIEIKYLIDEQIDDITTVVVVVSGAYFFLAQYLLRNVDSLNLRWLIVVLLGITAIIILRGIYFDAIASINASFSGHYKGIPSPLELLEEQKDIYQKVKSLNDLEPNKIKSYVDLQFDKRLIGYYSEMSDHNQKVNDMRLRNAYIAKVSMIYAFIALALLAFISLTTMVWIQTILGKR